MTNKPSKLRQATSFTQAVIKHAASGFKESSHETIGQRQFMWALCEHLKGDRCRLCGCKVIGKGRMVKTRWASEACPDGRWDVENKQ